MLKMKHLAAIALLGICTSVLGAGSTVDPAQPVFGAAMSSTPIRNNFAAAYNDINALIGQNAAATAPASPALYQRWLDTSATPYVLKVWDGSTWIVTADLNTGTHLWYAPAGSGGTGLTSVGAAGNVLTSTGTAWISSTPITAPSIVSANGFSGSVANPTTTPAVTLSTSITGMLKGSAGALAAASTGVDYSFGTSLLATGILKSTTTTGALSVAANSDLPAMTATVGGAVPTPPNDATKYLNGAGAFTLPGTSVTGIMKGNGTTISAATSGTDYSSGTSALATGIVKSTTATGALTIAGGADLPVMTATVGGAVPTPPNNTTTFLRGDGTFAATSGGSASNFVTKTTAYTAVANDFIFADTSGGPFTITMPASAGAYAQVCFIDAAGTFASNTLTIGNNGLNIMGLAANMTVTTANASFCLSYYNATYGWRIK